MAMADETSLQASAAAAKVRLHHSRLDDVVHCHWQAEEVKPSAKPSGVRRLVPAAIIEVRSVRKGSRFALRCVSYIKKRSGSGCSMCFPADGKVGKKPALQTKATGRAGIRRRHRDLGFRYYGIL